MHCTVSMTYRLRGCCAPSFKIACPSSGAGVRAVLHCDSLHEEIVDDGATIALSKYAAAEEVFSDRFNKRVHGPDTLKHASDGYYRRSELSLTVRCNATDRHSSRQSEQMKSMIRFRLLRQRLRMLAHIGKPEVQLIWSWS